MLKIPRYLNITENQPLSAYTSLKVGGKAKYFVTPTNLKEFCNVIKFAQGNCIKYKLIGNGTNLLFSDKGYDGMIVCAKGLKSIYQTGNTFRALCGAPLSNVVVASANAGYADLASLTGIPATVGGAVKMNAGAFKVSVGECITQVKVLSEGKVISLCGADCGFSYRNSRFFSRNEIILSATFTLSKKAGNCKDILSKYNELRAQAQPKGNSCGSVFKNPKGLYVAELIERAGLKGKRIGGAVVSQKHSNFILTDKHASAKDVHDLILHIKNIVKYRFGVSLCEEVELVGDFD